MLRKVPFVVVLLGVCLRAQTPFDDLLPILRQPGSAAQLDVLDTFAARADATDAIAPLLQRIRAEAPQLDNDGCLALERILRAHPDATCPLEPLLEVIERPLWTGRQKGAQALALALPRAAIGDDAERCARAVVPLLASQRQRVFASGARCLAILAGEDLGDDPIAARQWFFARFGEGIDLLAGVHELVVVVRPDGARWSVDGASPTDLDGVVRVLEHRRSRLAPSGVPVSVVVQLPKAQVDAMLTTGTTGDGMPLLATLGAAGFADVTLAPDTDTFRAPFAEDERAAAPLRTALQAQLDRLRGDRVPGVQAAVVLPDGRLVAVQSGVADRDTGAPMPADGRMLAGSTGKTFFAALALQLVREGRLDLDARVSGWLGDEAWYARVPNANDVTVRHLLSHRSGVMRYELSRGFLRALRERPDHRFTPVEEIAFVLDRTPRFAAGDGFEYSDTNYVLLGLVLERITGQPCYDEIRRRFLEPLALRDTVPSVGRRVPGLVQGYAGADNSFGGRDAMLAGGELPFDPGFEGAGGGFASTAADLARWAKALYEGPVLDGVRDLATDGLPAPFGPDARYGLGVMIDETPLGEAWGHSGFFPGWMSAMRYWPRHRVAVAVMVDSSAEPRLGGELVGWATALAEITVAAAMR